MNTKTTLVLIFTLFFGTISSQAQWLTQSFALKAGWNAIYLHVDASHTSLHSMIGSDINNPISEVWRWNPVSATAQFAIDPSQPFADTSQWSSWNTLSSESSLLQRLVGNAAYLVHVNTNVATYNWSIKGHPLPPAYQWTSSGLNFVGFPTVSVSPPSFYDFLLGTELSQNAQIYQYPGGEMGAGNPAAVTTYNWRAAKVVRGQAFWLCKTNYFNHYFGPFEVDLDSGKGVEYADSLNVRSFRVRNLTATNLTVTMALAASETPPLGQTNITGVPPLLIRGSLTTNLTHDCSALGSGGSRSWTLTAKGLVGSEVEIVLGLNRAAMAGAAGELQAGILKLTDASGFTQVDIPVSATVADSAGLWVGNAAITAVGEYLKTYQRDANGNLLTGTNGQYQLSSTSTNLNAVPSTYPLRLIVHNPSAGGPAVLLQRVFCGLGADTNSIVTTSEAALNHSFLKEARRISATHLPWSVTNTTWAFDGNLDQTNLSVAVTTAFDDQASNPFVHTYHPDHDNLDATFKAKLQQGAESYTIQRNIVLNMTVPSGDFESLVSRGKTLSGDYVETITILGLARAGGTHDAREFNVRGVFSLTRISDISFLTVP